ncbi:MAG: amidohydrolase family protein [Verrucomicrobiales bacterium]|nr:amidohydrolase family protein [Verrucomicrobiales bacterium]
MRIDSHHHFWNYDPVEYEWIGEGMDVLKRDFGPADLGKVAKATKMDGFVSVQARQTVEETEWLCGLAEDSPLIKGVVGWVPLADAEVENVLESVTSPWLKGIRHVVQGEPDPEFILGEEFNRGVSLLGAFGLVYDVLIFGKQLPASIRFVDQHPDLPMVLDHIAKPVISEASFDQQWEKDFREIAKRENLVCKFSGVVTEVRDKGWSKDLIRPYWEVALEAFGPGRLMFGSDWPVCLLKADYEAWVATVGSLMNELSADEQADIMGRNAMRVYAL